MAVGWGQRGYGQYRIRDLSVAFLADRDGLVYAYGNDAVTPVARLNEVVV